MKDFQSVLKLFDSKSDSMEFCDDFECIQSILNYANEYIKPFKKIHHKGGNEPYINDIITKIRQLFRSKDYLNNDNQPNPLHHNQLRKITFFLILNTDVSWKYDLTNDQNVCHLINIVPQLPKCLLLACIWDLNLSKYLYECISYSPTWFPLPLVDGAVDSLKFADAFQVLDRIEHIVRSIYTLIARSDYRQTAFTKVDHKIILSKYYDHTADFLRHFFTPDAEKFDKMTKFRFTIYKGYVLKHILHLIQNCFSIYHEKPSFVIDECFGIFSLMDDKESANDNHSLAYSTTVDEALHKINVTLLDSLQFNVMQVEVGTFTDWVEEDVDDEHTLQFVIGTAVYDVLQQISAHDCFKHDVSKQLVNLAIKPKTLKERVKESTLGEIMSKLDNISLDAMQRNVWLTEFINRGALVFENDECMDTLKDNAEYLTGQHCQEILKYLSTIINNNDDDDVDVDDKVNAHDLKIMINKTLRKCNCKEIIEICEKIIDLNINDCLELNTFDSNLIEIFNKTTSTFYTVTDLCVMAQNPYKFFNKIFKYGQQNDQQLATFIEFIQSASSVSSKMLPNCLTNLFENDLMDLTTIEENTIPSFVSTIYYSNVIAKDVVITKLLYKTLINSLEEKNWRKILIILRTLLRIVVRNDFGTFMNAPVIVMVGQVLDQCRWDMIRYCEEMEMIVCKAIEFIQEGTKKFLPTASEIDKSWIASKTEKFKPITRYYFQRYSLSKDDKPLEFDVFLRQNNAVAINKKSEIVAFLCETFVRCTKKESIWLAKNSQLLPYFGDVISVLTVIIASTTVANSINCFRHCFQSYINIIKEIKLPSIQTNANEKVKLILEILEIFKKCSTISIYNELFMNAHSILFDMFENSIDIIEQLIPVLNDVQNCEAKQLLMQKIELLQK